MKIFPSQPRTTKDDALRLLPVMSSDKTVREFLKTNPGTDDLKRCVRLELLRGHRRRVYIIEKLIVRIQQIERSEIEQRMTTYLSLL
jgi:hypothetical protein